MKHVCAKVKGRSRGRWTHSSGERFNSNKLRLEMEMDPTIKEKRNRFCCDEYGVTLKSQMSDPCFKDKSRAIITFFIMEVFL